MSRVQRMRVEIGRAKKEAAETLGREEKEAAETMLFLQSQMEEEEERPARA